MTINSKTLFIRMISGLCFWQFEWIGREPARVIEKRVLENREKASYGMQPLLIIESEENHLLAYKVVSLSKFRQARVGQLYDNAHFVKHKKSPFAWVVQTPNAFYAKGEVFYKSLLFLLFFLLIMSLILLSFVMMIFYFLS